MRNDINLRERWKSGTNGINLRYRWRSGKMVSVYELMKKCYKFEKNNEKWYNFAIKMN
jgi:hypothetical protein